MPDRQIRNKCGTIRGSSFVSDFDRGSFMIADRSKPFYFLEKWTIYWCIQELNFKRSFMDRSSITSKSPKKIWHCRDDHGMMISAMLSMASKSISKNWSKIFAYILKSRKNELNRQEMLGYSSEWKARFLSDEPLSELYGTYLDYPWLSAFTPVPSYL
jgi:hypothetical protein